MLRLVSDGDVHGDVIRGLWAKEPELDLVRVQDVGMRRASDPEVLEWAAVENRVTVTQDRSTLVGFAWERVKAGAPMPGLLAIRPNTTIGDAIEAVLLGAVCWTEDEVRDKVLFIPL